MTSSTAITTLAADWQHVGAAWLAEVSNRTGSKRTPQEYASYVRRFLAGLPGPEAATAAHVHAFAYGVGPSGREPSPSTVIVRLAALQGFYDFARRMGLITVNPAQDVKRPRLRPPTPKGLTADELRGLLAAIPETAAGLRDRAIIITIALTGLRRSEVLGLTAGSLKHEGGVWFYSVRVKGGAARHRELPLPAYEAISRALQAQNGHLAGLPADARLFNISSVGFYANLKRYADRAGLGHVTPHALRHSAAKLRRQSGASLEDVQALLGHQSAATTAIYLRQLEGDRDTGWYGAAVALGVA